MRLRLFKMITFIFLESTKKKIANIFLILLYVTIWSILLCSFFIKKVDDYFKKQLKSVSIWIKSRSIFKSERRSWNDYIKGQVPFSYIKGKPVNKKADPINNYAKQFAKENAKESPKESEKKYGKESVKEYGKVPQHIYIVLKNNDVSIIKRKKLLHYFLDIIIYLYGLKVKHLTIYISDHFFTTSFYDDLTQVLFECNFFMKALISKERNSISYGATNEFVITKFKYPLYQNKNSIQKSLLKLFSFRKIHKKTCTKEKYIYEKNSLCLTFLNKEDAHRKIIEAVQKNKLQPKGEVIEQEKLKIWDDNLNNTIEKLLNKEKNKNYKNTSTITNVPIQNLFHFLKKKIHYIIHKTKSFFEEFRKNGIRGVWTKTKILKINKDLNLNMRLNCKKIEQDVETNERDTTNTNTNTTTTTTTTTIKDEKDEKESVCNGTMETIIQKKSSNKKNEFPIYTKVVKKTNNTESLKIIFQLLDNLIFQEKETIQNIKDLLHCDVPLYVKPIQQDIFTNNNYSNDSINNKSYCYNSNTKKNYINQINNHNGVSVKTTGQKYNTENSTICDVTKTFSYATVDVVISLRIGMIDYLLSFLTNYKKGKHFLKKHFFNFMYDYFSSFFFLYDIVHPFRKNGIQPWVLSESELYEFFSFKVTSIKKALSYYNSSTQRCGY